MEDAPGTDVRTVGTSSHRPQGMTAFTIVWFGQVVSLVGTAMTGFALTLWAYRTTGLATALSMVAFFNFAPMIIMSPIAGVLVDRWNRKWTMALSDLASGSATLTILILCCLRASAGMASVCRQGPLGCVSDASSGRRTAQRSA